MAWPLWLLGYPDQALQRSRAVITLAQELAHPFSLGFALCGAAKLQQLRRAGHDAQVQAEAAVTLSSAHGFAIFRVFGTVLHGWALAEQGQREDRIEQIRQGQRAAAQALLVPIYGCCTEGFDTADLQEARVWLDALGEEQ